MDIKKGVGAGMKFFHTPALSQDNKIHLNNLPPVLSIGPFFLKTTYIDQWLQKKRLIPAHHVTEIKIHPVESFRNTSHIFVDISILPRV